MLILVCQPLNHCKIMEEPDQCVPSLSRPTTKPNHWQEQDTAIKMFNVQRGSHEWKAIKTKIRRSLPSVNIDRIDRYQKHLDLGRKRRVCKKNNGIVKEAEVFFGNSHQDPITIWISEKGLDMSTYMAGSWGIGAYLLGKHCIHIHMHLNQQEARAWFWHVVFWQCKMVGTEKSGYEVTSYQHEFHMPTRMLTPTVWLSCWHGNTRNLIVCHLQSPKCVLSIHNQIYTSFKPIIHPP